MKTHNNLCVRDTLHSPPYKLHSKYPVATAEIVTDEHGTGSVDIYTGISRGARWETATGISAPGYGLNVTEVRLTSHTYEKMHCQQNL